MADKSDKRKINITERKFSTLHLLIISLVAVLFTVAVVAVVSPTPTAEVVYVPVNNNPVEPQDNGAQVKEITAEEAASSAESLIKSDLVPQGVEVSVSNVTKDGNFYKMTVALKQGGQETDLYSYMSVDGKYFYPSVFDVTKGEFLEQRPAPTAQPNQDTNNQQQGSFDAPDESVPVVKFFVMAFCPFGQQAEKGLKPVHDLLGDKVKLEPHYVIYENYGGGGPDYCIEDGKYCSMHGINEVNEDIRQLCINKNYDSDTFWNYLAYVYTNCSRDNIGTCWKDAARANGIDTAKIESCFDSEGVDLIAAEKALDDKYGVRGSPTVFINDQQYNGGRAPEDYKLAICSGFTDEPGECSQSLGSTTGSASGGC
ncbi:MAG: thioredoxin domain-containing protein [Candidatus Diapherotrites archaeon]|nr:thioredoxin domain-containing protein [Candidatus Diapherotrites archaeon]